MQSFCFEIKSTCKSCGNPLSINAFVNEIFCDSCNNKNVIPQDIWKSIVSENIVDIRDFKEGEGQNSKSFTGEYEFSLMFGKQKARCSKCKTTILDEVYNSFEGNSYTCPKCSNIISLRKPDEFNLQIVPSLKFIVGEEMSQFNTGTETIKKPEETKPVIFTCPSCGAGLEIDGTKRLIVCKYCSSKVYLPDDLWHELHPVKTVSRWYILLDEKDALVNKFPDWYDLSDVAVDNEGNIYIACEDNDSDKFLLWSFDPDLKVRWIRYDINYDTEYTGMTVTKDNKILLWNIHKRSLNIYSCKDGSDLPIIKGEDASSENPYPFNLKGCTGLISDTDNTILAVVNNTFVRFYNDGSRAPVWQVVSQKGEKPGLFSRLFSGGDTEVKIPSEEYDNAPRAKSIGDTPKHLEGEYTKINIGFDGYIYILDTISDDGKLVKYARDGNQIWKKNIPLSSRDCKPCADKNGYVYVLGKDDKDKTKLIRFSPDGKNVDVLFTDILDGGVLSVEDNLAVSPDGTIYAFRFYNVLKVFSPDLKMKFISDGSKKEDGEKLEEYKKRNEKES
jgi:DNA-directed RNA polymerase subunit RPC12/RpoP